MAVNNYHNHYNKRRVKKVANEPIDKLIYIAVILGPVMTLPQLYTIWVMKEGGVSIVSWSAYLAIALLWLIYGLRHRSLPIILVQVIWIIVDAAIIIGLLSNNK